MVKVYAPASIGNVSVGFDVLGAAVSPVDGSLLGIASLLKPPICSACVMKGVLLASCRTTRKKTLCINVGNCSVRKLAKPCQWR